MLVVRDCDSTVPLLGGVFAPDQHVSTRVQSAWAPWMEQSICCRLFHAESELLRSCSKITRH